MQEASINSTIIDEQQNISTEENSTIKDTTIPEDNNCDKDNESDGDEEENDDESKGENFDSFNGSGRTVTLQMLLAANVLQPGKSTMTIEYLGQKFIGDLLPDGKIKSQETETVFLSPSAWAMHCKRIINPDKKSGCGWASVKYKGKKLDAYKATWIRKCAMQKESTPEEDTEKKSETPPPPIKRQVLPHNTISNRNIMHDANTLIETVPFQSINKMQPFLITMSSSALLLADFHCHLTPYEVCGYLAGSWDVNSHTLAITKAYPCKSSRHDRQNAAEIEQEIQKAMLKDQLLLVGWYHSHPKFQSQPTLRDCDAQLDYQIKMRGPNDITYTPCVGFIFSPYYENNLTLESSITSFWVIPPPENRQNIEYCRPMLMQYGIIMEPEITLDYNNEMKLLIDYYNKYRNELINFSLNYNDNITYLEKLKYSLYNKFPQKQNHKDLWNFICKLLNCDEEDEFIPPKISQQQLQQLHQLQQQQQNIQINNTLNLNHNHNNNDLPPGVMTADMIKAEILEQHEHDMIHHNDNNHNHNHHHHHHHHNYQHHLHHHHHLTGDIKQELEDNKDNIVKIEQLDDVIIINNNKNENNNSNSDINHHNIKQSSSPELKILSLQEQLCLPSGLNMNPTRLVSPLASVTASASSSSSSSSSSASSSSATAATTTTATPTLSSTAGLSITAASIGNLNATHTPVPTPTTTANSSPRDSPITIPSNSASPAKFEIPIRASPSPAKSESGSSNRTRNSPAPSPGKFSISDISRNSPSVTPNKIYDISSAHSTTATANDLMAASLATLAGQLPSSFLTGDLSAFFQQQHKDFGSSSLNQLAAAAAKVGGGSGNKSSMSSAVTTTTASNDSISMYPTYQNLPGTTSSKSIEQMTNKTSTPKQQQQQQDSTSSSSSSSSRSLRSSSSMGGGGGGGTSYKTKLMKELEDLKNDPIKISELMRSPEYAALLLQQAEALGATTLGSLGFGADFSFLAGAGSGIGGSSNSSSSKKAAAAAAAAAAADYTNLLQASKLLGYDAYMQHATKATNDLSSFFQQQMIPISPSSSSSASSSSSSKKQHQHQHQHQQQQQQQQQSQLQSQTDYATLLQTYSKLFDTSNPYSLTGSIGSGGCGGSGSKVGSSSSSGGGGGGISQELSSILSAAVTGNGGGSSGSGGSSKKNKDNTTDVLNQLLQSDKNNELNALLYQQNKAAMDLNAFFMPPTAASSSSLKSASNDSPSSYYEKMQDYAALFQHHSKYGGGGIPDPLSKSTLAANNMFMSPSTLLKLQQDSLNAMMMKPPKSSSASSSSSTGSTSRVRESSASPASQQHQQSALAERLTPTKSGSGGGGSGSGGGSSGNSNRENPASSLSSSSGLKYNFSAVDLAISSVPSAIAPPSNTPSPSPSESGGSSSSITRRPSDTPPVDLSRLYQQQEQQQQTTKKRMEFSSIADLAAPPPAKINKPNNERDDVLNLSSND